MISTVFGPLFSGKKAEVSLEETIQKEGIEKVGYLLKTM